MIGTNQTPMSASLCFVADMGSQNPVDFTKLAAASWGGIKCVGVILRATRSNGQVDTAYASRLQLALKAGVLVGAYAFNTGEAAATQAARFLKATTPDIPTLSRSLDFETNPGGGQLSLPNGIELMDRTDQAIGRGTMLYSGDRLKSLIVTATDAQRDFLAAHLYWGCEYGPVFKDVDANGKPLPWAAPFLWQDTGDGLGPQPHTLDGLEAGADLSIFKGTRDQLAALWPGAPTGVGVPLVHPVLPAPAQPAVDIKALQAALNALGCQPPLDVDGVAGPDTIAAVKAYQADCDVLVDGAITSDLLVAIQTEVSSLGA